MYVVLIDEYCDEKGCCIRMDILHVVRELHVDLNLCCICQRKLSNEEMLYGVGQDNLVKGALDFPDDERSKRIPSDNSTKRSQIKYHTVISKHISEECDTSSNVKQRKSHVRCLVHLTKTHVLFVTEKSK